MLLATPRCVLTARACAVRLRRPRRAAMAAAAAAGPLRIAFVTGNAKKLAEARFATRVHVHTRRRACDRRSSRRGLNSAPPHQVNAILGTEHAARFVLDAVSLDLPELQVRARGGGGARRGLRRIAEAQRALVLPRRRASPRRLLRRRRAWRRSASGAYLAPLPRAAAAAALARGGADAHFRCCAAFVAQRPGAGRGHLAVLQRAGRAAGRVHQVVSAEARPRRPQPHAGGATPPGRNKRRPFAPPEPRWPRAQGFEDKSAYAQCIFAYAAAPGEAPALFVGRTPGRVVPARGAGAGAFGWDPVFEPAAAEQAAAGGSQGAPPLTYAEMPSERKNKISHRFRALDQLRTHLLHATAAR